MTADEPRRPGLVPDVDGVYPDLPTFLLARLDEDEQGARAAAPGPWEYQDVDSVGGGRICDPTVAIAHLHYEQPGQVDPRIRRTVLPGEADATGAHIARHDPARVLAEVEAKRRIVEEQTNADGCQGHPRPWQPHADYRDYGDGYCRDYDGNSTLRWLALPFADHADYRESWRP